MIEPITQQEFQRTIGSENRSHPQLHSAQEWWRGDGRVGVIILDKVDNDWSWVALSQTPGSGWKAYRTKVSQPSIGEARKQLFAAFGEKL